MLKPVLVFLPLFNFNFVNKIAPNCCVDFILNSSSANIYIFSVKSFKSINILFSSFVKDFKSTLIPLFSIFKIIFINGYSIFLASFFNSFEDISKALSKKKYNILVIQASSPA